MLSAPNSSAYKTATTATAGNAVLKALAATSPAAIALLLITGLSFHRLLQTPYNTLFSPGITEALFEGSHPSMWDPDFWTLAMLCLVPARSTDAGSKGFKRSY